MPALASRIDTPSGRSPQQRATPCSRSIARMARASSSAPRDRQRASAAPLFEKRGQLLPRERVGAAARPRRALPRAVDAGRLAAGHAGRREQSVAGRRHDRRHRLRRAACAAWSSPTTPASTPARSSRMGLDKILRAQEIALREPAAVRAPGGKSAGANLLRYRVESFVHGGALFRNLARLSAAGLPVIAVLHGSGTAGGAYMPG